MVLSEVRTKAVLAERAAGDHDFDRADRRLGEASQLLSEARAILGDDTVIADNSPP